MDSDVDLDWNSEQIDDDFIDKSDNEVSHNVNVNMDINMYINMC